MNKTIKLRPDTIFVGCTHCDHDKDFIWGKRGFTSAQEHSNWITREIISYRIDHPEAVMIHLGDGFLNSTSERALSYFHQWGMPIYYIWGNHESPTRPIYQAEVERIGFKIGEVYPITVDNVTFLGTEATFSINKQLIFAHHFPLAIWDKSHHGIWSCHSHCHGSFADSLPNYLGAKRLDCGVDVCKQYFDKPYITFDQLKIIMDSKSAHKVDHHGPETT
jgi:hypothetical protein